jgi:catechol 2,3-dioxygenase-like lactoylglutathione lyase family enzyme
MKRMHIHVGVENLDQSIKFYNTLFGAEPVKTKTDYAKWMLNDPRINFAISTRSGKVGVDHLGLQVEENVELDKLRERLKSADMSVFDEGETLCCYARSDKSWVEDPSGIAWEAYKTMADVQLFSGEVAMQEIACCTPETNGQPDCCEPSEKTAGCGSA